MRVVQCDTIDSWIGFTFWVLFEGNNGDAVARSSHCSFSSSHPFYLSFESEYTEEYFDMPLHFLHRIRFIFLLKVNTQKSTLTCHLIWR